MNVESRSDILAQIRAVRFEIEDHLETATQLQVAINNVILSSSSEALFRFQKTRKALLNHFDSLKEQEGFLSKPSSAATRRLVGQRFLSKASFAAYIVRKNTAEKSRPGNTDEGSTNIESALQIIGERMTQCKKQLELLEASRLQIEVKLKELQRHVQASFKYGLSKEGDVNSQNLLGLISLVLRQGEVPIGKDSDTKRASCVQAMNLLQGKNFKEVLNQVIASYLGEIRGRSRSAIQISKERMLKHAVRKNVAELLKQWREQSRNRVSTVARAILGMYFAFACEQNRDFGKLETDNKKQYENVLFKSSQAAIEDAVREILDQEILNSNDFDLLRYIEPIRYAFLEVTNSTSRSLRD